MTCFCKREHGDNGRVRERENMGLNKATHPRLCSAAGPRVKVWHTHRFAGRDSMRVRLILCLLKSNRTAPSAPGPSSMVKISEILLPTGAPACCTMDAAIAASCLPWSTSTLGCEGDTAYNMGDEGSV